MDAAPPPQVDKTGSGTAQTVLDDLTRPTDPGEAPAPGEKAHPAGLTEPAELSGSAEYSESAGLAELAELVARGRAVVLTGAGLSTESGIPDYRGPSGAQRKHTPMTFQSFTGDPVARHRYWARSYLGWRQIDGARPNAGHRGVTDLQRAGLVTGIVTQNVDGLHQASGARDVIELHGGLDRVICRNCGHVVDRLRLDAALRAANPTFDAAVSRINPDGDADLADDQLAGFVMVACEACGGGPLKPDVVFFGETVPRDRVEQCFELVDGAASLIVLGSSLKVMSGFRFVLRAAKLGIPVAIVNQGPTRGDGYCTVRVDAPLGVVLSTLSQHLSAPVYNPDPR